MIVLPEIAVRSTRGFAAFALIVAVSGVVGCEPVRAPEPENPAGTTDTTPIQEGLQWNAEVSGSGMALLLSDAAGLPLLRVACVRDPALMTVVAETFRPVGSEERLSFGVDGEPFTFVADPTADRPSGVEAAAPISSELLDRFAAARAVSAVYGAQTLGPHVPPDPDVTARFVAACRAIALR